MNVLLSTSIKNVFSNVRANGEFRYHLLNKQSKFLKTHNKKVMETLQQVGDDLFKIKPSNEIAKFEDYLTPNDSNIGKILNGIHEANESQIPVPGSTKQEKAEYVIEQYIYNKLKPLRLLDNIQRFNHIKSTSNTTFKIIDITNPVEWFPKARAMKRKIVMHVGPTNSGKTYNALKKLETCGTGYYAGPLRLLAREVYDKFKAKNIRCNLLTGEEVEPDIDQFGNISGLTSGTVEMISLTEEYDVVVLDEIQMINDPRRGSAWTDVVIGSQAKELHLCGEVSAVPLIRQIAIMTGDNLEIHEYNRLGELEVSSFPITQLSDFRKGDCVVAFSKKKILDIKAFLENKTDLKCGVIYGALPPETRTSEAEKFNNGEYDVLVASDAVGMGLNLKINRVVFTDLTKFDGRKIRELSSSQIKQIGGRAGRFGLDKGTEEAKGDITAIDSAKLDLVRRRMNGPIQYLSQATLGIPKPLLIKYFSMFPAHTKLSSIYKRFDKDYKDLKSHMGNNPNLQKSSFAIGDLTDDTKVLKYFEDFDLLNEFFLISDQLTLVNAPMSLYFDISPAKLSEFDTRSDLITKDYIQILKNRISKAVINFNNLLDLYNTDKSQYLQNGDKHFGGGKNNSYNLQLLNLRRLEILHKQTMLYMWLSYRFPKTFIDFESAQELKTLTESKISKELDELRNDRMKRNEFMFD